MKLIKNTAKAAITVSLILYAFCLFNGITFFDYTVTEDGGILSVIGKTYSINTHSAGLFWDAYTKAEEKAAELLPEKLEQAIAWISDKLDQA